MSRIKWISATIPKSIIEILEVFQNNLISHSNTNGFRVINYVENELESSIEALFYEKITKTERSQNPFEDIEPITITRYQRTRFIVTHRAGDTYIIKLIDPPKSSKGLITKIYKIFGFGVVTSPAQLDISDTYNTIIKELSPATIKVPKLTITQVPFGSRATAKIEITSATNAYDSYKQKYDNKYIKVNKITIVINFQGSIEKIEINSLGITSTSDKFSKLINPLIEKLLSFDLG